ncbi:hypothetical protein BS47DRAFT_682090 [Hydnum rufescens UP504]|uniref:Uncharacterized protein n=1 Tax=Hydnum rufescens UP504 TaxID=1448309 RepID=A0A9P6DZV9_9AGAM|nr:hypothetical protein BS47DRAFT_682090 [Hydnum rufescens UP504]
MDNASGTPRKRKLASSNVPLRAWDHILENCTPLSSTSRRRSPVKVVPPHTEYPPTLDAYDALERGVRELLLPEATPEIHIPNDSNLFTTGTRQENICAELPCGEPKPASDVAVPPSPNRSALNLASSSVLLQTDSPASSQIKVRRRRLISDSGSSAGAKTPSRSRAGSPIITRAPLQQSPLPNATAPSSQLPPTPPSTQVAFISSLSKIRVVRGRIESDSESSDGETRNPKPFLTRTLNVIPTTPCYLRCPRWKIISHRVCFVVNDKITPNTINLFSSGPTDNRYIFRRIFSPLLKM